MRKSLTHIAAILACVCLAGTADARELEIGDGERLLVVAPHPDDETLGAGGLIQRVLGRGGRVQVVLMTAGDGYRDAVDSAAPTNHGDSSRFIAYGERRIAEARAAVDVLGAGHVHTDVIGFPDGNLATLLGDHWWRVAPLRSPFTGAAQPPYGQALDPHLPYAGIALRDTLVALLQRVRPTIIALPDWLDLHSDHSATGVFAMLAVDQWLAQRPHSSEAAPRLLAYLIHWNNWPRRPPAWEPPQFPTAKTTTPLQLPADLPPRHLSRQTLTLSDTEIATKSRALSQHDSQRSVDPYLLGVFVRRSEPFTVITAREFPRVRQAIQRLQHHADPHG